MSNAPEEFEQLRKLLKLKRYEQPPPRFFNDFSRRVINGIEAQSETGWTGSLSKQAPWLVRLLRKLESNVLVAGSFATAICATLIGGIVYSNWAEAGPATASSEQSSGDQPVAMAGMQGGGLMKASDLMFANTNAFVTELGASPFDAALPNLRATPVSFPQP